VIGTRIRLVRAGVFPRDPNARDAPRTRNTAGFAGVFFPPRVRPIIGLPLKIIESIRLH